MKFTVFVFLAFLSVINPSFAEDKPHHWTYGEVKEWGDVPEFETCKLGKEQSPINIVKKEVKKSLRFLFCFSMLAGTKKSLFHTKLACLSQFLSLSYIRSTI